MSISGSGKIPAGEYKKITVRGSGRLFGKVRCDSFRASGSCKGERIECTEDFKTSGSVSFSEGIGAKNIHASGSLSSDGDITADCEIKLYGSTSCGGNVKCEQLISRGSLKIDGNIDAEGFDASGTMRCGGVLRAKTVKIKADRLMNIGSIYGNVIDIRRKPFSIFLKRGVKVAASIDTDEIILEHVSCPQVKGRSVTVGKGCKIDLVTYTDEINVSTKAKVGRIEKVFRE